MTTVAEPTVTTVAESVRIDSYKVELYGESSRLAATILGRDADGHTAVYIIFGREGDSLSAEALEPRFGFPFRFMFVPERGLPAVLDLLRNETPVFYRQSTTGGALHSGDEPVGESEILAKLAAL